MRVGIIGCGLMGQRRALHLEPDDVLVGGYDPDFPPGWTGKRMPLQSLIDESEALVVATPHDLLSDFAVMCVRAGKHVLLEKPCGRSAIEVSSVLDAMTTAKVVVVPGFTLRHYPGVRKVKDFLANRELQYMRVIYGHPGRHGYEKEWRCDPERGGGELLDQGTHLIDLTHFLLGLSTLEDYRSSRGAWGDVDDTALLWLKTPRGMSALQASWTLPAPIFQLEVVREDESAIVTGLGGNYGAHVLHAQSPGAEYVQSWPDARQVALREEWRSFKAAVRENRPQISDALDVIRIVDDARSR